MSTRPLIEITTMAKGGEPLTTRFHYAPDRYPSGCLRCYAYTGEPCRTYSGKPTRPHAGRPVNDRRTEWESTTA